MNGFCLLSHSINRAVINSISITLTIMSICIIAMVILLEKKFRRMNNDLYYREELFNSLCSNVDDAFVIYDVISKKYEYISPNFENAVGISRKVLFHDNFLILEYLPVDIKDRLTVLLSTHIKNMLEISFEYKKPHARQNIWIMLRIYPVYNSNSIIRYIASISDITKEKQYQKTIEEALANVQKANEAKKEFLSHISHELKTPINAIIGMAQIASNSLENREKTLNCLEKIYSSSKELLTLINNILDISKIDLDKLVLVHEPFHLSETISSLSAMMKTQAELHSLDYSFLLDIKDEFLIGDSLRLIQILENCLSNSIKFTPAGGKVRLDISEVETHKCKALYRFIISDTGKGMSEEYLKRLFTPFEQEDSTIAQKYGGTGIGMTITKELINLMSGDIQVVSKINCGTTITIDLLFSINTELTDQKEQKELKMKPVVEYDCRGKRILVVEDNEINLEITCEFLSYIKAKVETASDGYEAIHKFEASEKGYYDIILMDLQMPELDGYETTKAIRSSAHPDAGSICIIALTADNFSDNQASLDCGMNYHITKPIDIDNFYLLLQNVMTSDSTPA